MDLREHMGKKESKNTTYLLILNLEPTKSLVKGKY